ncbi:ABC transporter substrate-binding protein [Roseateles microcysteis]|uniref:ABC transporter substrate-binding protein n=1 Tax=Roseateles microcysteis TaxID=3119057 RepID=UPI002FE64D74
MSGLLTSTRRELLGLFVAGGLGGAALGAQAQTPRQGGRIRVAGASAGINDTLDPAKLANQTDYSRGRMFYNGLTELDNQLSPQPALAEEFSSRDAQTWVFRLRRGVTFHDGKPLTPADVVFSLMRHKNPATGSKVKALADQIETVAASGPLEVTVTLKAPNADLPVILGTHNFVIVQDGTTDFSAGIGTGAFRVQEFRPGVRSIAVRNKNYWKPGRPYLDEIEFVGISDDGARVNGLLSGDLDLVAAINPRAVKRVQQTPGYAVLDTPSGQYTDLIMRGDLGPGRNPDFVLAMKHLLDRELLRKVVAQGHATIANDQPIDPSHRFHFAGLPQRPYDPERARFHFRKSGLAGTRIPVVASPVATYSVEIAVVLQHAARRIGMTLDLKRMPGDGYWSNHWLQSPVGFGNTNPRPSADTLLTQFFKSDSPWNEARWKSPRFDQLLLSARAELDLDKRKSMYADMQVMIHEQGGLGIPMFISSLDGHSQRLRGLRPNPLGGLMASAFAEHVWLEGA